MLRRPNLVLKALWLERRDYFLLKCLQRSRNTANGLWDTGRQLPEGRAGMAKPTRSAAALAESW